jgi:hypothetical protein
MAYPPGPPPVQKTAKPIVGGILIILGSLVGITLGAFLIIGTAWLIPFDITGFAGIFTICGAVWLILGIIGFIGGIFAAMRKGFGLAITGGIFSMITGGIIFGLIGLILVAISKSEFQ